MDAAAGDNMRAGGFTPSIPPRILAFDSGIGGLSIVAALRRHLPHAHIDYLADTAFFPYGGQEDDLLKQHIVSLLENAILRLDPDVVVIACNTASTLALTLLRETCGVPFVGCVPPIRWAARITRSKVIGLLATPATVRRSYITDLRNHYAPDCNLIAYGARDLAALAESAFRGVPPHADCIRQDVAGLFGQPSGQRIDAVALGCTHYTFVADALRAASPPDVAWLDPADAVARQTRHVLETTGLSTGARSEPEHIWFTAPPYDPARLENGLKKLGYDQPELWTSA
ncbi:glutamate racemase [Acetobacter estunensis]|uniref:glutamate racemase n=1 Tax=Acetobacter estunensis TaxID=104097 RepID=UPI0020C3DB30|nr:glutamate racemase [Acetobacter estunensis]